MIRWDDSNYLMHYGMPRRSGRYKWGSGKDPYHHGADGGFKKVTKYSKRAEKALAKGKEDKATKNMVKALGEQRTRIAKRAVKDSSMPYLHEYSTGRKYEKEYEKQNKRLEEFEKKYDEDTISKLVDQATRTGNIPKKLDQYMDEYASLHNNISDELLKTSIKEIGYKGNTEQMVSLLKNNKNQKLNNLSGRYNTKASKYRKKRNLPRYYSTPTGGTIVVKKSR